MRKIATFSIFVLLFTLAGCACAHGADWLENFEDVPHMENTYTIQDDGFVYSVPDGKVIQTTVASDVVTRRQFQRFYRDALYELGWKKTRDERKVQVFERNDEQLTIEILGTEPLKTQFTLTSK